MAASQSSLPSAGDDTHETLVQGDSAASSRAASPALSFSGEEDGSSATRNSVSSADGSVSNLIAANEVAVGKRRDQTSYRDDAEDESSPISSPSSGAVSSSSGMDDGASSGADPYSLSSSATSLSLHDEQEASPASAKTSVHLRPTVDSLSQRQQTYRPAASSPLSHARSLLEHQAASLLAAARRLREEDETHEEFSAAQELVLSTLRAGGKLIWTGVGKSGIIAHKLCSTSLSLGIPSTFLDPVSALHGDLGLVNGNRSSFSQSVPGPSGSLPRPPSDVVIALSHSGSSSELLTLLPHVVDQRQVPVIALTAKQDSALGKAARQSGGAWIDCRTASRMHCDTSCTGDDLSESGQLVTCTYCGSSNSHGSAEGRAAIAGAGTDEADPNLKAPTSSTTTALAMGDALVLSCARALGLGKDHFARNHPGGALGKAMSVSC